MGQLIHLAVDESQHNMDGLLLHGRDGANTVEAFISRRVMDRWVDPIEPYRRRKSLFRAEYNSLGERNLPLIAKIIATKYARGVAGNRQYPFVDILTDDIEAGGEQLDLSTLSRCEARPGSDQ
jgi:hypothetical protein